MPNRRSLLLALTALPGAAAAAEPVISTPPLYGDDPYGLKARLGSQQAYFDRALRELQEPPLLTADARVEAPTFRLVELRSFHKARCARITFDPTDGSADALCKFDPGTSPARITFGAERGLRLRLLLEDRERFWDAASTPPDWDRVQAESQPNVVYVTADGGSTLLEARVGAKRHAIVRQNPEEDSLLGRASFEIFGRRR